MGLLDVFDLSAKIRCDSSEYDDALDKASERSHSFLGGLGSVVGTAAKVTTAAVAAAGTAIAGVTQQAVGAYAQYEQLVGGVETLFGDSADKVLQDAQQAFNSAGMSMNQYMETSIQSAAAMINSLDGDQAKAAELMNVSITDMADNVNKMGTTMEAVQNAYRGFSRGNFTMLDNLALGFAGTKEGMQELLDKAQEISGVEFNIDSYSDIVQAIHVVQQEMGISGTTAAEAAGTISGSFASLKAAWENLVTGFADPNADIGSLINNMVAVAENAFSNMLPTIEQAIGGIAGFIERMTPVIAEKFPALVDMVLPSLLSAATQLINALVQALPSILQILFDQIPMIFETIVPLFISMLPQIVELGIQLILALVNGIAEMLPTLIPTIVDVVVTIVETLIDNVDLLIDAAIALIIGLTEGIINALPRLIERIPEIVVKIVEALITNIPKLNEAAKQIIFGLANGIISFIGKLGEVALDLMVALAEGIVNLRDKIFDSAVNVMDTFKDGILGFVDKAKTWGKDLIDNFVNGIKDKINSVKETVGNVAQTVKDILGFSEPKDGPLSNFHTYAPDMMNLFAQGIRDNVGVIQNAVDDAFNLQDQIENGFVVENRATTNQANTTTQSTGIEEFVNAVMTALSGLMVQVNIGDQPFDDMVSTSIQRTAYRSGGR